MSNTVLLRIGSIIDMKALQPILRGSLQDKPQNCSKVTLIDTLSSIPLDWKSTETKLLSQMWATFPGPL